MSRLQTGLIFWAMMQFVFFQTGIAQDSYGDDFEKQKAAAVLALKKFPKQDTGRVNALVKVFNTAIFLKQRKDVLPYCEEALAISRRLGYDIGLASCYSNMAHYYKSASDKPTAHTYFDSVLYVAGNSDKDRLRRIKAHANEWKGMLYFEQENFHAALNYFYESLKYPEYVSPKRILSQYAFINDIYLALNNMDKAMEYAEKGIALAEKDSSVSSPSSAYFAMISTCIARKDARLANYYLDKMSNLVGDPGEVQVSFGYYMKRGQVSELQQKYNLAFMYFQQAYKYALQGNHKNSKSAALSFLSGIALKLGNTEAAKKYALENLALAEETNARSGKIAALVNLSHYYNATGKGARAFEILQEAIELKDSLIADNTIKQVNVLGAMYETDKRQKELAKLQYEKGKQDDAVKQKSFLNTIFIAAIVGLLIFGYLAYRNFRNRQQIAVQQQAIQKQKITELEKDKQLLAIDAMLEGQEEERSRIAKDLHDGLGSLLSGTKLSFMNVKDNLVMSPENGILFDKSLSMLDNTIGDLRKIAHNLMPEALVKFGLSDALRDFCDYIQFSTGIEMVYQQFGEKRRLANTAQVFIYRIVQELVNNSIKYADASRIIVQLTVNPGKTGITVEDNGKGFDKNIAKSTKGAGMANIAYRVQYFNGTMDVVTSPGNGTSINIELIA